MSCRRCGSGLRRHSSGVGRSKIRTVKITGALVLGFVLCWTPYNIRNLWYHALHTIHEELRIISYCTDNSGGTLTLKWVGWATFKYVDYFWHLAAWTTAWTPCSTACLGGSAGELVGDRDWNTNISPSRDCEKSPNGISPTQMVDNMMVDTKSLGENEDQQSNQIQNQNV